MKKIILLSLYLLMCPLLSRAQNIDWKWIEPRPLSATIAAGGATNYKEEWGGYDMIIDISKVNCKLPVDIMISFYREKDVWHPIYKKFPTLVDWDKLEMMKLTIESATNRIANGSGSDHPGDLYEEWFVEIRRNNKAPFTVFVPSGLWVGDDYGERPADYTDDKLTVRYFPYIEIHDADERYVRSTWVNTPYFSREYDLGESRRSITEDLGEEDLSDLLDEKCYHQWVFKHQKTDTYEEEDMRGCTHEVYDIMTIGTCVKCGVKMYLPKVLMPSNEQYCVKHNLLMTSRKLIATWTKELRDSIEHNDVYELVYTCLNDCCYYEEKEHVTETTKEPKKTPPDKCPPHMFETISKGTLPYLKKEKKWTEWPESYHVIIGKDTLTLIRQIGKNDSVYYLANTETTWSFFHAVVRQHDFSGVTEGKKCPVTNISFQETLTFIYELNEKASELNIPFFFTLPSEEEWKRAAEYTNLNNIEHGAWLGQNSGNMPHQVGVFSPHHGFYDMVGNVREFVVSNSEESDMACAMGTHFNSATPREKDAISHLKHMAYDERSPQVGFRVKGIPDSEVGTDYIVRRFGKILLIKKKCRRCGLHKTLRFKL